MRRDILMGPGNTWEEGNRSDMGKGNFSVLLSGSSLVVREHLQAEESCETADSKESKKPILDNRRFLNQVYKCLKKNCQI